MLERADTVVLATQEPSEYLLATGTLPADLAAALDRIGPRTRIVSLCASAFLLAAAGLLDGKRAPTHWALCEAPARLFPDVEADPDVQFVILPKALTGVKPQAVADESGCTPDRPPGQRSDSPSRCTAGPARPAAGTSIPAPGSATPTYIQGPNPNRKLNGLMDEQDGCEAVHRCVTCPSGNQRATLRMSPSRSRSPSGVCAPCCRPLLIRR